jgi:hypothetical protein
MENILVKTWEDAARTLVHVGWHVSSLSEWECVGTGVLLNDRSALTARHVVEAVRQLGKPLAVIAFEIERPTGGIVNWRAKYRLANEASSGDRDVSLLTMDDSIETAGAQFGSPLAGALLSSTPTAAGDLVDAYGLPPTTLRTSTGPVVRILFSGMMHVRRHVMAVKSHMIEVTNPNPHGMSGGPLFNERGSLIGIASETIAYPGQQIGSGVAVLGGAVYMGLADVVARIGQADFIESD